MQPFYQDEAVTILNADCRDVLATIDPATVTLLIADPPYGVNENTQRRKSGRGSGNHGIGKWPSRDFPSIYGDDEPFDPSHLLRFRRLILFGANHYADRLPPSPSWLVWDKLDGLESKRDFGFNDNGDAELIWTNLGGPVRLIPHRWMGLLRDSEIGESHVHPTQKPIALMQRLIERFTNPGDLILDPYCGSGPVPRAAKNCGRRCLAIEISADYCRIAANRLAQTVLPFAEVAS